MGEVYRARDAKLGRDVAIKVLPTEMSQDPERLARFDREARTLATLQHANVASIYGFETEGGTPYLVMELADGQDLSERLQRGAIPVDENVELAIQMAKGLAAAHAVGIIHRDLKPANIKISTDGKLKILDFGLARAAGTEEGPDSALEHSPTLTAMTMPGVILGTAAYMSPEQARGTHVDHRADIWAFGVVLFGMLSGNRVFEGDTVSDTLAGVLRAEVPWDQLPKETAPATWPTQTTARTRSGRPMADGSGSLAPVDSARLKRGVDRSFPFAMPKMGEVAHGAPPARSSSSETGAKP